MSIKLLLGLGNTNLTDTEIVGRIKDALDHRNGTVVFQLGGGRTVELHLPHAEFTPYNDPWDGLQTTLKSS